MLAQLEGKVWLILSVVAKLSTVDAYHPWSFAMDG